MTDFRREDLAGSSFEEVTFEGARFRDVDLRKTWFHSVDLRGAVIRGAWAEDVDLSGEVNSFRINGVDVAPLVEAELNRRYPDRAKMRPSDPEGFREAWAILERLWAQTVERARGLPEEKLHESVDGEWSFIQTLRHLVFATDAWINRAVLGEPSPWDPLGIPHDEMPDIPGLPRDREARPTLDEVLAVRADRQATVRRLFDALTDDQLEGMTEPVSEPGYPESVSFPVTECLHVILSEEWEHRLYAERDMDALEKRAG